MALFARHRDRRKPKQGAEQASASPRPAAPGPAMLERDVYHGTLRSELDEPARLRPEFIGLIEEVGRWRIRYERNEITRAELAEALGALRAHTPDGAEWTLGATSGQWYRRYAGGEWSPALPPEADEPTPAGPDVSEDQHFDALADFFDRHDTVAEPGELPAVPALPEGAVAVSDSHPDPAEAVDPWPAVTAGASFEDLPAAAPAEAVIDEIGVWDTTWEAPLRSEGYPDPPGPAPAGQVPADDSAGPAAHGGMQRAAADSELLLDDVLLGELLGGNSAAASDGDEPELPPELLA